jgi:hypothetical protein
LNGAHPPASRTACRCAFPLAGGNTGGPAQPVPRCSWRMHAHERCHCVTFTMGLC